MSGSNGKWVNPIYSQMDAANRQAFDALSRYLGGWQDFTPQLVWSSSGTQPSLGNGVKEAQFRLLGDECFYEGAVYYGSSTTAGTGSYTINLPFPAHTSGLSGTNTPWIGSAKFFNAATGLDIPGIIQIFGGSIVNFAIAPKDSASNPSGWAATTPHFGNGDNMCWTVRYRVNSFARP